jgi:hypothetical protein
MKMKNLTILGRFYCVRPAPRGGIIARLVGVPELGDVFIPVRLDGEVTDPSYVVEVVDGPTKFRASKYVTLKSSWDGLEVLPERISVAEVRSQEEAEAEQVVADLIRLNGSEILSELGLHHLARLAAAKQEAATVQQMAHYAAKAAWERMAV